MPQPEAVLRRAVEAQNLLGFPRVFTARDLELNEKRYWLQVHIAAETFRLPVVNVGTQESPLAIAFLDSNPKKNARLAKSVADHMSLLIAAQAPTLVVMPGSKKSEPVIRDATRGAADFLQLQNDIPLIRLPTDRQYDAVRHQVGVGGVVFEYHPVTLKPDEHKYIGVSSTDLQSIQSLCPNGDGLLLVDDVGTTMATIRASEKVLSLGNSAVHHVGVFAREAIADTSYPPMLGPRLHTAIFLPEMPMPADQAPFLFSPADVPAVA